MGTETTLRTVERALWVLELVGQSPKPPLVREIADQLNHNLASTYHIVNTLLDRDYLTKDEVGRLELGSKIGVLNAHYVQRMDFAALARNTIVALAEESGETIYLTKRTENASVIESVVESKQSLRVSGLSVGFSGSEDRRASGKAVLAYLADEELRGVIQKLYPDSDEQFLEQRSRALKRELEYIREQGYAMDIEVYEEGVCCVAAPYFLKDGSVGGAVAASAPATRRQNLEEVVRKQVLDTTSELSKLAAI